MRYKERLQKLTHQELISQARKNAFMHDATTVVVTTGLGVQLASLALIMENHSSSLEIKLGYLTLGLLGLLITESGVLSGFLYSDRYFDLREVVNRRNIQIPQSLTYRLLRRSR